MKLAQIGLINWANLPNRDYPFHPDLVMITGHSAAGKTTLLDAIQTVMTAARHGVFQFNPGQEAATQHSRHKETRSVASYVLGCDDGSYARPEGAHAHLIAVFEPDNPAEQTFTAVISVTAHLELSGKKRTAKEDVMQMAVIPGYALNSNDFTDDSGKIIPPGALKAHFKKHYPSLQYEPAVGKDDYLCRLYGALKGQSVTSRIEAKMSARQLSKFMAYKPLGDNLDTFVRDEILEAEDLSDIVSQISLIMRNIHSMEQEAKQIEHVVNRLTVAKKHLNTLIAANLADSVHLFETNYRKLRLTEESIVSFERQTKDNFDKRSEHQTQIESFIQQMEAVDGQLHLLEKKAAGIPELGDKLQLESELITIDETINDLSIKLVEQNAIRSKAHQHILQLAADDTILFTDTGSLLDAIIKTDIFEKKTLAKALQNGGNLNDYLTTAKELQAAYQRFFDFYTANKDTFDKTYFDYHQQSLKQKKAREKLDSDIRKLDTIGRVSYPKEVSQALKLIEQHLPLANARILCDFVDVRLKDWQLAIEGLLANNRFLIIVDEAYEADTIKLLKQAGLKRTGVVQGEKARRDIRNIPQQSIVNLLTITDETAKAYLIAGYGQVIQVSSEKELRLTARGLMQDGLASSSYRMYQVSLREDDLVFGVSARHRSQAAKRAALDKLIEEQQAVTEKLTNATLWRKVQDNVLPFSISGHIEQIMQQQHLKEQAQKALSYLDLSEHDHLLEEITHLKQSKSHCQTSKDKHISGLGRLDEKEKSINKQLTLALKEKLSLSSEDTRYREFLLQLSTFDEAIISRIDEVESAVSRNETPVTSLVCPTKIQRAAQALNQELWEINREPLRGKTLVFDELLAFAINPQSCESILKGVSLQFDLHSQIESLYQQFNNDLLVTKKASLKAIADEFKAIFVNDLCHRLYNSIKRGKAHLDKLNLRLRNFIFGEEYYQFSSHYIAEFKDYVSFFEEIYQSGTCKDGLFERLDLTAKSQAVFDKIRDLLLSDDFDKSKRELERLTDYRNYRSYDILKHIDGKQISLKSYGTGSGAQLETPSYVIKAAALGAALKFDESESALRMVLIDESFSKMDIVRCRQVLDYLSIELRLQVIFVVPNTKGGSLHDLINDLYDVCKVAEPAGRGELKTRVHVEHKRLKKEQVAALYQKSLHQVQDQAEQLSFLDLVEA